MEQEQIAKTQRSGSSIHPLLNERYSLRAFSNDPVSDNDLELLLEAARWACSSHNEQPWRFLVTRKGATGYMELLSTLGVFNRSWADKAPVLVLNMVHRNFARNGEENYHARHDLGGALAQLTAQATAMGMGLHQLAGFDPEMARQLFTIPDSIDIVSVLALGYPGDPSLLEEHLRERELHRTTRKPLTELVFSGLYSE